MTAQTVTDSSKPAFQTPTAPFVRIFLIGIVMQIIYVVYIVAFPLISNTQAGGPAADLEILMRDYRWFAPFYVVGILLLYYLFWETMKVVSKVGAPGSASKGNIPQFSLNDPRMIILVFGLLFGFTLIWLYPITAYDLFLYVLRGRVWAIYGESPMLTPITQFPNDPHLDFGGEFANNLSNYGPLWEILVQGPFRLGTNAMVPGSVSLKLIVLLAYLLSAILIGWFAVPQGSKNAIPQKSAGK